jgi:hypothetical protein|tara:strand:- start:81 stop:446 length:366 start_codon:yes stop_codon:yes gene_type:complete
MDGWMDGWTSRHLHRIFLAGGLSDVPALAPLVEKEVIEAQLEEVEDVAAVEKSYEVTCPWCNATLCIPAEKCHQGQTAGCVECGQLIRLQGEHLPALDDEEVDLGFLLLGPEEVDWVDDDE